MLRITIRDLAVLPDINLRIFDLLALEQVHVWRFRILANHNIAVGPHIDIPGLVVGLLDKITRRDAVDMQPILLKSSLTHKHALETLLAADWLRLIPPTDFGH